MSGISSQQKEGSLKKREREQGLKSKRGKTPYEEAPCYKKKRLKFTSCWERFYQKKDKKGITFCYSAKSDV
jgi:hypothetical protein